MLSPPECSHVGDVAEAIGTRKSVSHATADEIPGANIEKFGCAAIREDHPLGLDIPDQIRNAYNKAKNGEFLTPDQRQDMLGQATELYGTARKNADTIAGRYRNLAGQYGVDPERAAFLPPAPEAPRVGPARSPSPASGPLDVGASRDAGGGVTIRRVR